jgi:hypothetical protein
MTEMRKTGTGSNFAAFAKFRVCLRFAPTSTLPATYLGRAKTKSPLLPDTTVAQSSACR